jgi:hypothetical protein
MLQKTPDKASPSLGGPVTAAARRLAIVLIRSNTGPENEAGNLVGMQLYIIYEGGQPEWSGGL